MYVLYLDRHGTKLVTKVAQHNPQHNPCSALWSEASPSPLILTLTPTPTLTLTPALTLTLVPQVTKVYYDDPTEVCMPASLVRHSSPSHWNPCSGLHQRPRGRHRRSWNPDPDRDYGPDPDPTERHRGASDRALSAQPLSCASHPPQGDTAWP